MNITFKKESSWARIREIDKNRLYQAALNVKTVVSTSGTYFVAESGISPEQKLKESPQEYMIIIPGRQPYVDLFYSNWLILGEVATYPQIQLPNTINRINNFKKYWNQWGASPLNYAYQKSTEVSSDTTITLERQLTPKKYNLLLRIRSFRKKVGKIKINVCDLLREVREHA